MSNIFRGIRVSLAAKLIVAIGILILAGGTVSWFLLISSGKKYLLDNAVSHIASYSDMMRRSVRYGMLTNNRDAIYQTIGSIGSSEHVDEIRILDAWGKVFYSTRESEIGSRINILGSPCIYCHRTKIPGEAPVAGKSWTTYRDAAGRRTLTFIEPIYNEPSCTISCHVHSPGRKVLGVLETDFSLWSIDNTLRQQTFNITLYTAVFMILATVVLWFIHRILVVKPVQALSGAIGKVGQGDLSPRVDLKSRDEMGLLGRSFNDMVEELEISRERTRNWTETLEKEIARKTEDLKRSRDSLIQAEKLAALGRLTSDMAHEIRNPLTAIGGFARRLYKISAGQREKEYAHIMVSEVDRLEKILRDVLTFSREPKFDLRETDLREVIREAVELYRELCLEQSVEIVVEVGPKLPPVLLDRNQAVQAIGNLISNALEAMPSGGVLRIRAFPEERYGIMYAVLMISDTGPGIPGDKLPFIFEPFFSSRETGYGTGLGLAITRKIMEEFGGLIKAESGSGKGTAFALYFPYQSREESLNMPCWEFMKCGRDRDASSKCPAYPHFGRICWGIAGTFCAGKVQGTFAQKCENCSSCAFFRTVNRVEAGDIGFRSAESS